jgi:hypothetical protein
MEEPLKQQLDCKRLKENGAKIENARNNFKREFFRSTLRATSRAVPITSKAFMS